MDEDTLRRRLKRVMGKDVEWIEPAWGSTVGRPDCDLLFDEVRYPVELKLWKLTKFGIKCEMRPAQIRYHIMSAKKGLKTAIMFGLPIIGSANEYYVYMTPGRSCPKDNYEVIKDMFLIGTNAQLEKDMKKRIKETLQDERFWG